jgi:hypothetical protein
VLVYYEQVEGSICKVVKYNGKESGVWEINTHQNSTISIPSM